MKRTLGWLVKGRKTVVAKPTDKVSAVARKMRLGKVGAAPVMDGDAIVGIFTERDLLNRIVGAGKNAAKIPVSKVMTKKPVTVLPSATVPEALETMRVHKCRHLPLVEDGKLLGIVSQRDIVTAILEMKEEEIDGLKELLDLLPIEPGVG